MQLPLAGKVRRRFPLDITQEQPQRAFALIGAPHDEQLWTFCGPRTTRTLVRIRWVTVKAVGVVILVAVVGLGLFIGFLVMVARFIEDDGDEPATTVPLYLISETGVVQWDWPRSAPEPTGPVAPPPAALAVAPGLAVVLRDAESPYMPSESRHDWPTRATLAELWGGWWTESDTAVLRRLITPDVDAYVRGLIDDWGGLWPQMTMFGRFGNRFPALRARLRNTDVDDLTAGTKGLWSIYREEYPWPDPVAKDCVVCGRRFPPEGHWASELGFGPPISCKSCTRRAMNGHDLPGFDVKTLLGNFTDALGFPPPSDFRANRELVALNPNRADMLALLVAMPDSMTCSKSLGVKQKGAGRWLATLQAAGVVGEAWKMPRGVMTFAADGHLCRSMGELAVERYLIAHGIEHEVEPSYPDHPTLNPSGRKRADWLIGEVWVEYAGMMSVDDYAKKMGDKVELAQKMGLNLLVLTPDDLPRLGGVFAAAGVR